MPTFSGRPAHLLLLAGLAFPTLLRADEPAFPVPAGLRPVRVPKDNPMTEAKVALGKQLFWDPRLSIDESVSCASCHHPQHGWSNGEAVASGVRLQKGGRSAPTIINTAYQRFQFWDGRAATLEEQALGPIENPIEMAMPLQDAEDRIGKIDGYRSQFDDVFGDPTVNRDRIAKAIAAYERTILSGDAPYDRFKAGDEGALTESAQRGRTLFFGKARCSACHSGSNFTDNAFHNIGVGFGKDGKAKDEGRSVISKLGGDRGSFKTPTLREIARTAPYMHDGSEKTLEDVVKFYNRGGNANPWLDEEIAPLKLTEQEIDDLVTFMKEGLASDSYPNHEPPELPK